MSPAEAQIRELVEEAFRRLTSAITQLLQKAPDDPQTKLYVTQLADKRAQWARVDADFFGDRPRQIRFVKSIEAFGEAVKATTERVGVGFWDGFWTSLGQRYVQMLDGLPTLKGTLSALSWIVPGVAILAVLIVLGPEIKAWSAVGRSRASR